MQNNQMFREAMLGDCQSLATLLDNGIEINARDERGRTALMIACWASRDKIVQFLIERGADVNAANASGTTAFMYAKSAAMSSGNLGAMDMLLRAGAAINMRDAAGLTALHYAQANSAKIVEFILQKGGTL